MKRYMQQDSSDDESTIDDFGIAINYTQSTQPRNNIMLFRFYDPTGMPYQPLYQPYLPPSPPPPPSPQPYQFITPPRRELQYFHAATPPESDRSAEEGSSSATASWSRMTWDQDDTEILVQCWVEVQRRFKATPRITGKKKILKPKGTELWRGGRRLTCW